MKLPKFKNFISNTIVNCLFDNFNIYEENLYAKDSTFEVSPINFNHSDKTEMDQFLIVHKQLREKIDTLNKSPESDTIMNTDFSFIIHFDSHIVETGISLQNLIKISKNLHTDLLFINGDGNDYQLGEFTSGHDSEVILHVQFKGTKDKLIADYQQWYIQRHEYLTKKIEEQNKKNHLKK